MNKKALTVVLIIIGAVLAVSAAGYAGMSVGLSRMKAMEVGSVDLSLVPDGEHEGKFTDRRWSCSVRVTVAAHTIMHIEIIGGNLILGSGGSQTLIADIISEQTPAVDTVSGATVSSKALQKAVENALRGAITD